MKYRIFMVLLCTLAQTPAPAATINAVGSCTIVDAVSAANLDAPVGACNAGSGADTIVLASNATYTLVQAESPFGAQNGLPSIDSVVTIQGNGSAIRRDPDAPRFRILTVGGFGDLTMVNTRISGGVASFAGGGILVDGSTAGAGTLRLVNSTVSDNLALVEGGDSQAQGGGISVGEMATAIIVNSTVSGNEAASPDEGLGGGIFVGLAAELTLTNTTVAANFADSGGGIYNGGAGAVTLAHTLVSGNVGRVGAPELFNDEGTVTANNFNLFGHDGFARVSGFTPGTLDVVPSEPRDRVLDILLRGNGGPTITHALVAGSPAIDAVSGACVTPTDQRGVPRPQGPRCDIGAYEAGPPVPPQTANRPPVVSNPGNQVGNVGQSVDLVINASDPDGDSLNFIASNLPIGLSLNVGTGRVSGRLAAEATVTTTVSVVDGRGGDTRVSFRWAVLNPSPPITPIAPITPILPVPFTATPLPLVPPSGISCTDKKCRVRVQCIGAPGQVCMVSVRILVGVPIRPLTACVGGICIPVRPGLTRQAVFASGVSNVPAGQIGTVRTNLRRAGKQLIRTSSKRIIRGTVEVRSTVGVTASVTAVPTRIKLPRR